MGRCSLTFLLTYMTTACSAGQDYYDVPQWSVGHIGWPETDGGVIVAPETVQVRVPFTVTISTFGSSTCGLPGKVEEVVTGNLAIITPFDLHNQNPDESCTADIGPRPYQVGLMFGTVGRATIRVRGHRLGSGAGTLTEIERAVVVRP